MNEAIIMKNYSDIPDSDLKGLLSLRYDVFKLRLNWNIKTENNLEKDDFDTPHAHYIYHRDSVGLIDACWRIIPTTQNYMLSTVFSILLGEDRPPKAKGLYELSRFAISKKARKNDDGRLTMEMFRAAYEFSIINNITSYITVTSVAIERMLITLKIPFRRIGNQKVHTIGTVKSVAISMKMNEEFATALSIFN